MCSTTRRVCNAHAYRQGVDLFSAWHPRLTDTIQRLQYSTELSRRSESEFFRVEQLVLFFRIFFSTCRNEDRSIGVKGTLRPKQLQVLVLQIIEASSRLRNFPVIEVSFRKTVIWKKKSISLRTKKYFFINFFWGLSVIKKIFICKVADLIFCGETGKKIRAFAARWALVKST